MSYISSLFKRGPGAYFLLFASVLCNQAGAVQYSLESSVSSRVDYNSNVFLTDQPHEGVSSLIVTPEVKVRFIEANWGSSIDARLSGARYSDHSLDSFGQSLAVAGSYSSEKNTFGLSSNYNLQSSLNSESTDFGIVSIRVKRRSWSIGPNYRRLISKRLNLSVNYNYTDTGFIDDENTGFVPFRTDTEMLRLVYSLSERDRVNTSLQAVQYESKDGTGEYSTFTTSLGASHRFAENLSGNISVGQSRNNTTNRRTDIFEFVGTTVMRDIVVDARSKNLVLNVTLEQDLENGSVSGSISRSNTTSSFGGLDEADNFLVAFLHNFSPLLSLGINTSYGNIEAINAGTSVLDRKVLSFVSQIFYVLDRDLVISATYQYLQRKFKDQSVNTGVSSNKISFSLTYRFPELSTF